MATKKKSTKKSTKKPKKPPAYQTEAKKLTDAEWAGILEQLNMNSATNTRGYNEWTKQRQGSLAKQIGSDRLATEITGNVVTGLKGQAMGEFDRSAANNQAARDIRDASNQARNSNALTNYEAEMKARGISADQQAAMSANFKTQQDLTSGLDAIDRSYQDNIKKSAGQLYDMAGIQTKQFGNAFESNARAEAQANFNEHYNSYVEKRDTIAADLAKAKKDKGAAYLNTYMTLKKEAEQRAAEKAAAKLSAQVSMAKQASSDYFRSVSADQAQQRIDISKDKYLSGLQKDINSGKISAVNALIKAQKAGVTVPDDFWTALGIPKPKISTKNPKTGKPYGSTNPAITGRW